jgi:hypothetical protein
MILWFPNGKGYGRNPFWSTDDTTTVGSVEDVSQFEYRPDNTSKVKLNRIMNLFLVYLKMLSVPLCVFEW